MYTKNNGYILFWISQTVSQLGSSMTGFALIIWAYRQTHSAISVSLLTFFTYLAYVAASIFAGALADSFKKKTIILWTDSIAAICSLSVLMLLSVHHLQITYIYMINIFTGCMNAFQSPASAVAVGYLVPKGKYTRVSGLNSFSSSVITVVTPMLASFISSYFGLEGVLLIDIATFLFAFFLLLLFISIPDDPAKNKRIRKDHLFLGCREGFAFLIGHTGLLYVIFSIALLNFFSRLTYENILPVMLLSRSGGNEKIFGLVSGILGAGGIAGSLIITVIKAPKNNIKMIYLSAAFSFLFGDLLMGIGQNVHVWIAAGLAASIPIPFVTAGQNLLVYKAVPQDMQGRVFAVRNAIQYFTIPIGTLLGGVLADYIFEPFMNSPSRLSFLLQQLVGTGNGSGMAVMFLCTGILGFLSSVFFYNNKQICLLEKENTSK